VDEDYMMHADQLKAKLANLEKLLKETDNTAKRYVEITSKAKTGELSENGNELIHFDEALYNKLMKVYKDAQEILVKEEGAIDKTLEKVKEMQKSGLKRKTKGGEPASPASKAKIKKVKKEKSDDQYMALAGDLVAARTPNSDQWILAKVIAFNSKTTRYEVEDAAPEEDEDPTNKKFICIPEHVQVLPPDPSTIPPEKENTFAKGPTQYLYNAFPVRSPVLGMFPHTTTFYPATVVAPIKKGKIVIMYQLQFEDDTDDHTGTTPSRKVSAQYVVPFPEL